MQKSDKDELDTVLATLVPVVNQLAPETIGDAVKRVVNQLPSKLLGEGIRALLLTDRRCGREKKEE